MRDKAIKVVGVSMAVLFVLLASAVIGFCQIPDPGAIAHKAQEISGWPAAQLLAWGLLALASVVVVLAGAFWWLVRFILMKLADLLKQLFELLGEVRDAIRGCREGRRQ